MSDNITAPLVSLVMPVYNAEAYLDKALDRALSQKFQDFECIIVDDGSTDGSRAIIDAIAKTDSRVCVIAQKNSGVATAMNHAIRLARGKYIARVDSDDITLPNALVDLVRTAKAHPTAILVCGSYDVIDEKGVIQGTCAVPVRNEDIKRALCFRNPIGNGGTLVYRQAILDVGGIDAVFAEDHHLWTKLYDQGDFVGTGTVVYQWRTNPRGLTLTNPALSISSEQSYAHSLWHKVDKRLINRDQIKDALKFYAAMCSETPRLYQKVYLHDLARFALQLLRHHQTKAAIIQLYSVGISSWDGAHAVFTEGGTMIRRNLAKVFTHSTN